MHESLVRFLLLIIYASASSMLSQALWLVTRFHLRSSATGDNSCVFQQSQPYYRSRSIQRRTIWRICGDNPPGMAQLSRTYRGPVRRGEEVVGPAFRFLVRQSHFHRS